MAHEIEQNDGMMYTGETPWHKLGVKLDNPATAAEAIAAAGLDWEVAQQDAYTLTRTGQFQVIEGKSAIVRQDTQQAFGVLSKGYQPVQNTEAFQFFDEMIGLGEAIYHTAGSLNNGRRIWILAKLPEDIEVVPGDPINQYILLMNSHDGSLAMRVINTPIRVVCANTLSMALRATGGFYAKHTRNILTRASEARNLLTLANAYYDTLGKQIDRLVHTRMTEVETANYVKSVYQFKEDKKHEQQDYRMIRSYEATMELLNHPTNTLGGIQGTQYAAFNAVTYYIDHLRPVRVGNDEDGKRLDGSWFGHGATIRQRAYDLLAPTK